MNLWVDSQRLPFHVVRQHDWDQHLQIYVFGREINVCKFQSPKAVI